MSQASFKKWILEEENRWILLLSAIAIVLQFTFFKLLYPYPNFLPDSYSYLEAAFNNTSINLWPVGYSKFLRLLSCFTHSDTVLIFIQYLFLQAGLLYFLFTFKYLLSPDKWVIRLLFFFGIFNPLLLYTSNFVSSDALFTALSLTWFTQLLWILHGSGQRLLIPHAIVLLFAFMVRYNALYYPFISIAAIITSTYKISYKARGIALVLLAIGTFSGYTIYKYHVNTGNKEFSAFGGWQLASNALFAYARSPKKEAPAVPQKFRMLHEIVNRHMDSIQRLPNRPDSQLGAYYLWDEHAPLKQYMKVSYSKDTITDGFKKWASMAPLYADYGSYLIQQYPAGFMRHYILPNLVNYYVPSTEFLALYNMGNDTVDQIAQVWFDYKSNKVHAISSGRRISFVDSFPFLLAIVNLFFALTFIGFFVLEGLKSSNSNTRKALCWMCIVWTGNLSFSVLASPVVLRYQLFPMIITLPFLVHLMAFIVRKVTSPDAKPGPDPDIINAVPPSVSQVQLS